MKTWPGQPYPLGATWDGRGANFALFSENATAVELCLFSSDAPNRQTDRIRMTERTNYVWHTYLPDARPGLLYAYRVYGPFEISNGHRFNSAKLLLDPYAKAIEGDINLNDSMFGYTIGDPEEDLSLDRRDSSASLPKCALINTKFDWEGDVPLRTPWSKTLIYELHVKGFTARHPAVPDKMRGTYAGLARPTVIEHLKTLGVTAVELMPIHHFVVEKHLIDRGLTNYWGYNSIGYFAPDPRYSYSRRQGGPVDAQVVEFKTMVKQLHRAGIEVILDVVYNHTAEGNHMGPTICFRGIDNASYYRLVEGDRRYYMDYTGCGNTLNMIHPRAIQLMTDSLRYWIQEMHVDGFRFDLAAALARELHEVDRLGAFFDVIHQDPVISQAKLIAEPWDLGEGGYQVGNFPALWAEWNGIYRDTVRGFWRGDDGLVSDLAYRLTGSSDLYEGDGRKPYASVNFVTAHDGFTLTDLVSYNEKHNEANGEANNDGHNHNLSWNCGVEGPTDDPGVNELRARQSRNFIATLMLSQGVPMLLAGDEMGRTQNGNNNAYCQDNKITWLNWNLNESREQLLEFTRLMTRLFHEHPVLRRRKFFQGRRIRGSEVRDLVWFRADGEEMTEDDWNNPQTHSIALRLAGDAIEEVDDHGAHIIDDTMLIVMSAEAAPITFTLPTHPSDVEWELIVDTRFPPGRPAKRVALRGGAEYRMEARSLALFKMRKTNKRPAFMSNIALFSRRRRPSREK